MFGVAKSYTRGPIPHERSTAPLSRPSGHKVQYNKRARGQRNQRLPFAPPENWYEPAESGRPYRFVVQEPGRGYRHVVTQAEVRARLDQLPAEFVRPLEVVQFSRITRKKQSFPCYGMQWGAALYLYPIEEDLVEFYNQPPKPAQRNEARMYGGRWVHEPGGVWKLMWTEESIKDFYLNNILIHELGHLLDDRNSRPVDRERFAEWFAVRHGYRPTRSERMRGKKTVIRRHHGQH
ncbi:MAG: hypothetical protein HYX69_15660 [Planctomycetia bacterium]|nr:hypothetical protein [Planctomycetia bacterium]